MSKEPFGGPKAYENLDNPEVEIKEGEGRKGLPVKSLPKLTEVGEANVDPDTELAREFEKKKGFYKTAEDVATNDIESPGSAYDPTEDMDARIDNGGEKTEEEFSEIKGPKSDLPPEIKEINDAKKHFSPEEWNKLSEEERGKILAMRKDPRKFIAEVYMTPQKHFVKKEKHPEGEKKAA